MGRIFLIYWMMGIASIAQAWNPPKNLCGPLVRWHETVNGIPRNLLSAISLVESGRKVGGTVVPWPWTINANGKPYVFASKQEAISMVRKLRLMGIASIDVGCMQVNLKQHPHAFPTLEAAFDPATNIAYAAKFLKAKKRTQGSWMGAVAHYHSSTAKFHAPYKMKVLKAWLKAHKKPIGVEIPTRIIEEDSENHEGELIGNVAAPSGRRVPMVVRFAPYRGFGENIPEALTKDKGTSKVIHSRPKSSGKFLANMFGIIPIFHQRPLQIPPTLP